MIKTKVQIKTLGRQEEVPIFSWKDIGEDSQEWTKLGPEGCKKKKKKKDLFDDRPFVSLNLFKRQVEAKI